MVPVGFYASWVVGADEMFDRSSVGRHIANGCCARQGGHRVADFEFSAGFQQVDIAVLQLGVRLIETLLGPRRDRGRLQNLFNILVSLVSATEFN